MASVLIFLGIFFAAGVWSFWKQEKPKSVVLVLGFASAMCLAAGIMRY
ncbi:hypothetical protein [Streptomyces sp. TLI_171]|nr:hypothetical protein [Streptomyces sp. TLI_171]RKE18609.1 hypothetical protein BX266_1902 [Streptomyces sp. TLI_171]